ncbi:MAG: MFS transporter [Chloroflexi bacterium]|nr:MFS transporter [Chloroflexota bacterium]
MSHTSRIHIGGGRTLHAFQNHSYRLLWPANFFSYISRWMQMTFLTLLVLELTDSPFLVASVGFFGMIPMLLIGVFGGVMADKVNRKKLLIATQTSSLIVTGIMAGLLFADAVRFWYAYLAILAVGIGSALDMPSRRSLMHDLLGRAGVTNAVALDSIGMHSSKMIGPALAGLLVLLVDFSGGFVVIIAFYLVSLALLRTFRLPERRRPARSGGVLQNLMEGFRYVRSDSTIMAVILITIFMNFLLFSYMQMVPVIARDDLGVGPGLIGLLMSADGLGALIGGIMIASSVNITRHGLVYFGGSMLALVMLLLFALSPWYASSLAILIVLGLGTAGFGTMQGTIVMLVAPEEMRGRALGVISLAIGAGPLGALLVGAVADATSPAFAIGVNSVAGFVLVGLVGLLMTSLRKPLISADEPAGAGSQLPPQEVGAAARD